MKTVFGDGGKKQFSVGIKYNVIKILKTVFFLRPQKQFLREDKKWKIVYFVKL